jgi:hypothetical protein
VCKGSYFKFRTYGTGNRPSRPFLEREEEQTCLRDPLFRGWRERSDRSRSRVAEDEVWNRAGASPGENTRACLRRAFPLADTSIILRRM